ncbi:hypothetical protein GFS03_00795 [Sulfolobus sp. E5-1-F]|uniref:hypothetical protein n=1 Tax=Sulfolobaceae TaxID=118883 RepID=UPI0012966F27|nr:MULTISPECIES: hypothetical protein [unclassified Sulfolobus]QGA53236.1 hypothetical protein GFS03_00795 [Sulfolobus sp. E5-1-F]QGA68356.1 hypothetical protein GFS33_05995 [Sulfolobus sp. E11-6]
MKIYTIAGIISGIMALFFIILSLPLNLISARSIGVDPTSIIMATLYMLLASIIFVILFKGINKL